MGTKTIKNTSNVLVKVNLHGCPVNILQALFKSCQSMHKGLVSYLSPCICTHLAMGQSNSMPCSRVKTKTGSNTTPELLRLSLTCLLLLVASNFKGEQCSLIPAPSLRLLHLNFNPVEPCNFF